MTNKKNCYYLHDKILKTYYKGIFIYRVKKKTKNYLKITTIN